MRARDIPEREYFGVPFDTLLRDFPRTEFWRLCTDAWQHQFGLNVFRSEYYAGIKLAFAELADQMASGRELSDDMIERLQKAVYRVEEIDDEAEEEYAYIDYGIEEDQKPAQNYSKLGFRHNTAGGFGVSLAGREMFYSSAISEEGLDEFVDCAIAAGAIKVFDFIDKKPQPSWSINLYQFAKDGKRIPCHVLNTDHPDFQNEAKQPDKNKLKNFLLTRFSELRHSDDERKKSDNRSIQIRTAFASEKDLRTILKDLLNQYYHDLAEIKESGTEAEDKKLVAIVRLLRKIHQNHFFADGNGRLSMLLKLFLLSQSMGTLAFTMSPAHITGFSERELVAEMREGIALFNEFKVTNTKAFLSSHRTRDDLADREKFKNELSSRLSATPVIALAQINELFLSQMENKPVARPGYFHLKLSTARKCYRMTQSVLKELYYEKVCEITAAAKKAVKAEESKEHITSRILPRYGNIICKQSFIDTVKYHSIIYDAHYVCKYAAKGKNMTDILQQQIDGCRYPDREEMDAETIQVFDEFGKQLLPKKAAKKSR